MSNVYGDLAQKYFDRGLIVTPLIKGTKRPLLKDWQLDYWYKDKEKIIEENPNSNIGLVLGKMSGVIAVDIDKDSALKLVPLSPVIKKGAKGETRFFKYNGEASRKRLDLGIEILSDGNQTVLPPSIHPETKKEYTWVTPDHLLDMDINDLPNLDSNFLKILDGINVNKKSEMVQNSKDRCKNGSHEKISDMLMAALHQGDPINVILKNILEFDEKENDVISYFLCPTRKEWKTRNRKANALSMINEAVTRNIRKGEIEDVKIEDEDFSITIDKEINLEEKVVPQLQKMKLPKLSGIAQEMFEHINKNSSQQRTHLIYPTVMSVISTVIGNKIKFKGVFPNLYTLVVGESGIGKSSSQDFASDLFDQSPLSLNLLSDTSISSVNGITQNLKEDRVQLKIIDEVAALFKKINDTKSGGEDIGSVLAELYTKVGKRFGGKSTGYAKNDKNKKGNIGGCFSPYVNLLMATTFEALQTSFTPNILNHGFFARADIYYDKKVLRDKDREHVPIPQHFIDFVEMWRSLENELLFDIKKDGKLLNISEVDPAFIPFKVNEAELDKEAENTFESIKNEIRDRKFKANSSTQVDSMITKAMVNRQEVLWMKYALISAVSRNPRTTNVVIKEKDLIFAKNLVYANCNNAEILLSEHMFEGKRKALMMQIIELIRTKGRASTTDINRGLNKKTSLKERDELLKDMEQSGMITTEKLQKGGKIYEIKTK